MDLLLSILIGGSRNGIATAFFTEKTGLLLSA
jgi:hypothetical protein